jgi:phosphatidyl-myo-inositol dimannoside synthase
VYSVSIEVPCEEICAHNPRKLRCSAFAIPGFSLVRSANVHELTHVGNPGIQQRFLHRTSVVLNGVMPPDAPAHRKLTGKQSQVLFVGAVKESKGVLEAIEACARYMNRYGKKLIFRIVGSYDENSSCMRSLRKRIDVLGMKDCVQFTGRVDDATLEQEYANTDLFIMLSKTTPDTFEGFGLVYLEANARGVPVIGPDDSGAAEAIEEGVSGYKVDVDDADMIAKRMHMILSDQSISSDRCIAWAKEHSLARCCVQIERVYASVLNS